MGSWDVILVGERMLMFIPDRERACRARSAPIMIVSRESRLRAVRVGPVATTTPSALGTMSTAHVDRA
ncbi:hypothetical protein BD626DRAFT_503391 [Schizophyllum amplum]|uniref:Uncharacterized protein n=1 Tax=Schizophyllum amplum TaxID=97359 RepID=A0A550C861_9AGAR|nr:hypothetical protein BD626DRAFT_503391 [Auriculariopsis ampla]